MSLRFEKLDVRSVGFGAANGFAEKALTVNLHALEGHLKEREPRIKRVEIALAHPGDPTRILCCKDVVQPRLKMGGTGPDVGTLRVLDNVAIATCGPIVGFQEGIIDMSGPGAAYTPFSQLSLIVLELTVAQDLTSHEHETVLREAGLAAAHHVAQICADARPDSVEEILWDEVSSDEGLPRLAYVYMVLSQGLLHDTYVLGENATTGLPRLVDPRIALTNGVISGNCVSACDKNTTYHHQNHPIISQLLSGHGARWNFVGVVMTNALTRLAGKEHSAREAIRLVQELQADAALVSKEGFGNPDADLMMIVRGLEQAGVTCVALTDEYAGSDGASQSLADTADEADAVISTGNANERIVLPAMENSIGPLPDVERLAGGYASSVRTDGSMEVELQAIMGATNELGFGYLSCQEI